jgi:hypothetical protein
MMTFRHERGEGKGNLIFGLLVLFLAMYIGWKVIPVMIRVYAFEDRAKEECKFLRHRTPEILTKDLIEVASVEDIEIYPEDIKIKKLRVDTYDVLRVNIDYTVPIATPVKVFEWTRSVDYEAPIFE